MKRRNLSSPRHISEYINQSYSNKLRDPRWQKKRLERLQLSGWKCDECGDAASELQVHHRWYLKNMEPWDYAVEQLSSLCVTCHEQAGDLHDALKLQLSFASVQDQIAALKAIEGKIEQRLILPCQLTNYEDCLQRNQRLAFCFWHILLFAPHIVANITRLHDHKGLLQVYAKQPMAIECENAIKTAWEQCMEYHVEFIYADTSLDGVWWKN